MGKIEQTQLINQWVRKSIWTIFFLTHLSCGTKNIVLISAPGSGKGTFSQYCIEKHGYEQVCPGDILRHEILIKTEFGKKIQPIVEKGDYIDDALIYKAVFSKLHEIINRKHPFIIDGFPRSLQAWVHLRRFLQKNKLEENVLFLQLVASDSTCMQRIVTRQICPACFYVYNTLLVQAKQNGICDNCGNKLTKRQADIEETAKKRLLYFHTNIEPLLEKAAVLYTVKKLNAEAPINQLKDTYEKLITQ